MRRTNIFFAPSEWKQLVRAGKRRKVSAATIVREAVDLYFAATK